MVIEEIKDQPMCALFAPDGSWQGMTLAPDFPICLAQIKMLHKAGLSQSYHVLSTKGFKVMPIKITMTQAGDEETAFQNAKEKYK